MLVSQIITQKGLRALREDRILAYHDKAVGFLEDTFPLEYAVHGADAMRNLAGFAYRRSDELGFRRAADHLNYLAICVYWGVLFDKNPLHEKELLRANWVDQAGRPHQRPDLVALGPALTRWQRLAVVDGQTPSAFLAHLNACRHPEWGRTEATEAILSRSLNSIWPDRIGASSPAAVNRFSHAVASYCATAGLSGNLAILFAALAVQFGLRLHQDPRYLSLTTAFADDGTPEQQRRDRIVDTVLDLIERQQRAAM